MLLEVALYRHMSLQYEVGAAKRIDKFCPSDSVRPTSVRPTDGLHALNICSCYVNNYFKQRDGSKCNPEELSYT